MRYFREGEEAAFFDSADDLARQVDHYLRHPQRREMVARRGRERCLADGYSLDNRMQKVVAWFDAEIGKVPDVAMEAAT